MKRLFLLILLFTATLSLKANEWKRFWQNNYLTCVHFPDAKNGWVAGVDGVVMKTTDSSITWQMVYLNTTVTFNAVFFTDTDHGYLVGDSGVYFKTSDAGLTWVRQQISSSAYFSDVMFINSMEGFIAADQGQILHTTDGGANWSVIQTGISNGIGCVFFIDSNHGWATGPTNMILRTIDGGQSWLAGSTGVSYSIQDVHFTSLTEGTAVGLHGTLLKSTNGGASWTNVGGASIRDIYGVDFTDPLHGYAGASEGYVFSTADGGNSWSVNGSYSPAPLLGVDAVPNGPYIIVGQKGAIFYNNIILANSNSHLGETHTLFDNFFYNDSCGFAVGGYINSEAVVYSTVNGGTDWMHMSPFGVLREYRAVYAESDADVVCVGANGYVCTGPLGFGCTPTPAHGTLNDVWGYPGYLAVSSKFVSNNFTPYTAGAVMESLWFSDDAHGWVCGQNGQIKFTANFGFTFTDQNSNTGQWLRGIHFSDSLNGFAVGDSGCILHTVNGGLTWLAQVAPVNVQLNAVFFTDAAHGWIVGNNGNILYTDDAGINWQHKPFESRYHLYSIFFSGPDKGWICGNNGLLLTYDSIPGTVVSLKSIRNPVDLFHINPNPSSGFFTIQINKEMNSGILKVYDVSGKVCYRLVTENHKHTGLLELDLTALPEGMYFISFESEQGKISKKVIIHRT